MHVLPLEHSRIMESAESNPRCSASVRTCFAKRSLILPLGLRNSHFAHNVTPSEAKFNGTVGVFPIKSSIGMYFEDITNVPTGCGQKTSQRAACHHGRSMLWNSAMLLFWASGRSTW